MYPDVCGGVCDASCDAPCMFGVGTNVSDVYGIGTDVPNV